MAIDDWMKSSICDTRVRSDVSVPVPAHVKLFPEGDFENIEEVAAYLPERTTLFRTLLVDFCEMVRRFSPDEIEVVAGEDKPLDLVYRNADGVYKARHLRGDNQLGHLDSFDSASEKEVVLGLRVAEALFASVPFIQWDIISSDEAILRSDIHNVIRDESGYGTWLMGSMMSNDNPGWFRTLVPMHLVTQEPFLPMTVVGIRHDNDGYVVLEGSGDNLVFAGDKA